MKVRDRSLNRSDYKGRETEALDSTCPCKPCYNPHDCGSLNSQGEWVMRMECATRWNRGCPPLEQRKGMHTYSKRGRVCKKCGARR